MSGESPARDARTLTITAAVCTALVFVVIASSAWLRLSPAGLPCPPGGCVGFTLADAVRIAHRVAAMGVSVLALIIAALAWKAPAAWGRRWAAVAIIALVAVLAIVGRQSSGTVLPAVTLTNLLGGLALLALTAGLAAAARAPAGRTDAATGAATALLAAAIVTGALASALPAPDAAAIGLVHQVLSWASLRRLGRARHPRPRRGREPRARPAHRGLLAGLALLAVTWPQARWLHNFLTAAALVTAIAAAVVARPRPPRARSRHGRCRPGPERAARYHGCIPSPVRHAFMQPGEPRTRGPDIPVEQFLVNLPLFSDLTPEEIARIAGGTRRIYASKGEALFTRGDRCEGFHVVLYGQVKLFVTSPSGSEKVIEIMGPGISFGEAILFMDMPYVVSAQALKDSLLLHVSKSLVFEEIERDPRFARRLLAGMSRKLHQLIRDVEAYSLRSGLERVIGYLLRDDALADGAASSASMTLPANKMIVASRLNLTPEYFSRILHELADAGLIVMEGRQVSVPDIERLRTYGG